MDTMARSEAEVFAASFKPIEIFLDDPDWDVGFSSALKEWNRARGSDLWPRRQDFRLVEVPEFVSTIQIFEIAEDGAEPEIHVAYQGSDLVAMTRDETGPLDLSLYKEDEQRLEWLNGYIDFCLRWPHPFWGDCEVFSWRRQLYAREKFISLPIAADGQTVNGNIAVSHFYDVEHRS